MDTYISQGLKAVLRVQMSLKDKTKAELPGNIKTTSVNIYGLKWKRVGELQDIARKK